MCVCVCVRTRADVPRSYTSLKLSSFPSLIPFTSLSLILSLTDHSLNPYHVLYSPTSCPCTALGIALTDVTSLLSSLSTRLHPLGPSYPPIYVHSLPSAFPPDLPKTAGRPSFKGPRDGLQFFMGGDAIQTLKERRCRQGMTMGRQSITNAGAQVPRGLLLG